MNSRLEWIRAINKLPSTEPTVIIGRNTRIHPTARIGEDGCGLAVDEAGNWVRAKQHGGVVISDRVHIDEFVTVKRASLPNTYTVIGYDTKISSFVNIGHNCRVGAHVFIGAGAVLNGSVEVGDGVWIGGNSVIRQHIKIGERALVGIGSVVVKDVSPGSVFVGNPARLLKPRA